MLLLSTASVLVFQSKFPWNLSSRLFGGSQNISPNKKEKEKNFFTNLFGSGTYLRGIQNRSVSLERIAVSYNFLKWASFVLTNLGCTIIYSGYIIRIYINRFKATEL